MTIAPKTTTTSTPQMTADWNAYFAGSQPGQTRQWGGGTLTRNADGTATFGYNGQNTVLRRDMPFSQVAALSPQIADDWYKSYGYTAPSNVTNQTVAAGNIPKMNAVMPFTSQGTGATPDSPFGMAGNGAYAPPLKPQQFWQSGSYDPSKGLLAGASAGQYGSAPASVVGSPSTPATPAPQSPGQPQTSPGQGSTGQPTPSTQAGISTPSGLLTQVTPEMSVEERAAAIAATDSPLMQQARGRAMQQMNERGLINSSLGIQAGQEAVLDRATDIAKADAQTSFLNSQNNANRNLNWQTAQLQAQTSLQNSQLSAQTQLSVAEINRQYSQMANLSSTSASLLTAFNNDVNSIVLSDLPAQAKEAAINARTQTLRLSMNVMGSINGDVDMNTLLNQILG